MYDYCFEPLFNDSLPLPNPDDAGPIVPHLMGLPITAGCVAAWIQTRYCSGASCTTMQCLRLLRQPGALLHCGCIATVWAVSEERERLISSRREKVNQEISSKRILSRTSLDIVSNIKSNGAGR